MESTASLSELQKESDDSACLSDIINIMLIKQKKHVVRTQSTRVMKVKKGMNYHTGTRWKVSYPRAVVIKYLKMRSSF